MGIEAPAKFMRGLCVFENSGGSFVPGLVCWSVAGFGKGWEERFSVAFAGGILFLLLATGGLHNTWKLQKRTATRRGLSTGRNT